MPIVGAPSPYTWFQYHWYMVYTKACGNFFLPASHMFLHVPPCSPGTYVSWYPGYVTMAYQVVAYGILWVSRTTMLWPDHIQDYILDCIQGHLAYPGLYPGLYPGSLGSSRIAPRIAL